MSTDQPAPPPTETAEVPPAPPPPPPSPTGRTEIADSIIAKIALLAAREVEGVVEMRQAAPPQRGWGKPRREAGPAEPTVTIEEGRAGIDLQLVVLDGYNIPTIVESVRARVISRVQDGTGIPVSKVDIAVVDLVSPAQVQAQAAAEEGEG